jgi:hypothetical protein
MVAVSEERPHGLDYSITLHGNENERLVGFDNAHAVRQSAGPGGKGKAFRDFTGRLLAGIGFGSERARD